VAGLEDLEEVYLGLGPKGGVTNSEWELSTVRKGPENWGGNLGKLWELGGLKRTLEGLEGLRRTLEGLEGLLRTLEGLLIYSGSHTDYIRGRPCWVTRPGHKGSM
jgi:hypothetical protein